MDRSPGGVAVLLSFTLLLGALFVGLFSMGSFGESPLTGQATHGTYIAFSAPEQSFWIDHDRMAISDTAVYKTAWYSVNGSAWQQFSLSGAPYGSSTSWLSNAGSAPLPTSLSGTGEHYVIVYTCTRSSGSWDCHGATTGSGGWQLLVINISDILCGGTTCGPGEYCSNDACLLSVPGNTYFVALDGNDSNPGNFTHPFATWQKAVVVSRPGDITYIRGGTYRPTTYIGYFSSIGMVIRPEPPSYSFGASGTVERPIRYFNYPGEQPILDGSLMTTNVHGWLSGISIENAEYIYLRGLTVRNIHQTPPNATRTQKPNSEVYGISSSGANMRFENVIVHDVDGRGFQHWSYAWNDFDASFAVKYGYQASYQAPMFASDSTTWINCDAYNLYDRYAENPGNAADGWKVHGYYGNYYHWEGCRAFNYSDDGFDPSGQAYRTFKNCWAMSSDKYKDATPGDAIEGNGFKMTGVRIELVPNYIIGEKNFVRVENSIAADCVGTGFYNNIMVNYQDQWPNGGIFYNNFAYKNLIGYTAKNGSIFRNNMVYDSQDVGPVGEKYEISSYLSWYTESNNSWIAHDPSPGSHPWWYYNPAFNLTADDFESLDATQLMRPRKADGSLPDIDFGHLRADSELIDAGMVVPGYHCATAGAHPGEDCRVWYGAAPDVGAFEYQG